MNEDNVQSSDDQSVAPSVPQAANSPGDAASESFADKIAGWTGKVDAALSKCLGLIENHPWEKWLSAANGFFGKFLPIAIVLAGVIAFVSGVVSAIRYDLPFSMVVANFGILLATLFSMHLAPKAMSLSRSFIEKREPDAVRPELLYILKFLLGLGGLLAALYFLFQFSSDALVMAIVLAIVSTLAIVVFSHPAIICTKADNPENAVEEAISVFLLPVKVVLALLTILVGVSTLVLLVVGIVNLFQEEADSLTFLSSAVAAPLFVPLAAYVSYLLFVFVIDLYRAIASLPRKLDEIRKALESK